MGEGKKLTFESFLLVPTCMHVHVHTNNTLQINSNNMRIRYYRHAPDPRAPLLRFSGSVPWNKGLEQGYVEIGSDRVN